MTATTSGSRRTGLRLVAVALALSLAVGWVAVATPAPVSADANEVPGAPLLSRSLTAGDTQTCALLGDGSVKCWGEGNNGQLGSGDIERRGGSPNQMGANLTAVPLGTGRTATTINAGRNVTCAILDNGSVKCWGRNSTAGELGLGDDRPRGDSPGEMGDALPTVDLGTGRTATALSIGANHTCALLDDATVKCWGYNESAQLGQGDIVSRGGAPGQMGDSLLPVALGTGRTATAVTAGLDHTCALLDNGGVKCWGRNEMGQLGVGDTFKRGDLPQEMGDGLAPVDLGTGRTATAITAGARSTCALLDNGAVKCWGENTNGQLGQGDVVSRGDAPNEMGDALPAVNLGTGRTAVALSAGSRHVCALLDNGSVKCWGMGFFGQLGTGSTGAVGDAAGEMGDALAPIALGAGRTALAVTTGGEHTCAVLDNLRFKCWGDNDDGQLGLGDTARRGDQAGEMGDALPAVELTGSGIAGSVTDSVTGQTLVRPHLAVLSNSDFSLVGAGVATGDGNYSIQVPPGQYYLYRFDQNGDYAPGLHGAPSQITVTAGMTSVTTTLAPTRGAISGTVTETGGPTPVAGAWVLALDASGRAELGVIANSAGQFTIGDLSPGTHYVAYLDPTGAHGVRFHPSATSVPTATPVTVSAGQTTVADGALPPQAPPASSHQISGRVGRDNGTPVGREWVLALRASDFSLAAASVTSQGSFFGDGLFHLQTGSGSFKLAVIDPRGVARMEWYDDQPANELADAATLTSPIEGINPSLAPTTGTIGGGVTVGGSPLNGAWVLALGPQGITAATTSGPGYQLAGLAPGNYRLATLDPATGRLEYWQDQTTYGGATTIPVAAGASVTINPDLAP